MTTPTEIASTQQGVAAPKPGTTAPTTAERVTFESQGETIVGWLFPAAFDDGPAPAAVIIGPENYQKEQAPAQYAPRFAQLGYTAPHLRSTLPGGKRWPATLLRKPTREDRGPECRARLPERPARGRLRTTRAHGDLLRRPLRPPRRRGRSARRGRGDGRRAPARPRRRPRLAGQRRGHRAAARARPRGAREVRADQRGRLRAMCRF